MKILHIHDCGYVVGGAEVVISELIKEQRRRSHEVRVLTGANPQNTFNTDTYPMGSNQKLVSAFFYTWNIPAVSVGQKVIADFAPDIIHLHSITKTSAAIISVCKNIPTVMTIHDFGFLDPTWDDLPILKPYGKDLGGYFVYHKTDPRYFVEKIRHIFIKKQLSRVNLFLPTSHFMQEVIHEYQPQWKTHVISLGTKLFTNKKPPVEPVILGIGRLVKEKGFADLLYVFQKIVKILPKAKLVLVGEGPELIPLKQLAESLKIMSYVEFVPHSSREKIQSYYENASVVVVSSHWPEPFGLIGPEAMSVSRPVVAYNVGGINEWLKSGKNGYLVSQGDKDGLFEKLRLLLKNPQLYKTLSQNASQSAKRFTIETFADRLEEVYKNITSS